MKKTLIVIAIALVCSISAEERMSSKYKNLLSLGSQAVQNLTDRETTELETYTVKRIDPKTGKAVQVVVSLPSPEKPAVAMVKE